MKDLYSEFVKALGSVDTIRELLKKNNLYNEYIILPPVLKTQMVFNYKINNEINRITVNPENNYSLFYETYNIKDAIVKDNCLFLIIPSTICYIPTNLIIYKFGNKYIRDKLILELSI